MNLRWLGAVPERCDLCKCAITATFIDGKTSAGPWAIMCPGCHVLHGCGLGVGRGQYYIKRVFPGVAIWLKAEPSP